MVKSHVLRQNERVENFVQFFQRMSSAYPRTSQLLGEARWQEILRDFMEIWGEEGDASWLPSLLMNMELGEEICELSQLERVLEWLPRSELDASSSGAGLRSNPSLQILPLRHFREPGVHAFWMGQGAQGMRSLREKKLEVLEAQILDLLREDLVWSLESLGDHLLSIGKEKGPETLVQLIELQVVMAADFPPHFLGELSR